MSLGSSPMALVAADPFALYHALQSHTAATKRFARSTRQKVIDDHEAADAKRRARAATNSALSAYLSKTRHGLAAAGHASSTTAAAPSSAALFDVVTKDNRRFIPAHKDCEVVKVSDWVKQHTDHTASDVAGAVPVLPQVPVASPRVTGGGRHQGGDASHHTPRQYHHGHPGFSAAPHRGTASPRLPNDGSQHLKLPPIERLTQRIVVQADSDFAHLSYGNTHIPRDVFFDAPDDESMELGGRRLPVLHFIKFLESTGLPSVSFPQYLYLVYGTSIPECVSAAKRWSVLFGWAADLTESTAKMVRLLWKRWTGEGETPFTLETFFEAVGVNARTDSFKRQEWENVFRASDHDGDGQLGMFEFVAFFSSGETGGSDLPLKTPPKLR